MSSSKGILADDGTLDLSGEYREMNSPESSSLSSAPSSIMQLLRPRFHNEMEALMKNYQVRIVDKDEFVDGQLVYRITLPLNPPQKEKWTSVDLDLWCYSEEETSTGYQLGYKISTEEFENFFQTALPKDALFTQSINHLIEAFYIHLERIWYPDGVVLVRDFAYPPSSSLHFGHSEPLSPRSSPSLENFPAKVIYNYNRTMEGELTVQAGECITVVNDMKNGWVVARRQNPQTEGGDIGLLPENYIERIHI